MTFEWDENKNRINKKKHGVSFEMAVRVYLDDKRIISARKAEPEEEAEYYENYDAR